MGKEGRRIQEQLHREAQQNNNFKKEYTGTVKDLVNEKFKGLDKRSKKELKETIQRDMGVGSNKQVTIYRDRDGKRRVAISGNN